MKKALVTGITGQDGSLLAELLLPKGYEVHGLVRRVSVPNRKNMEMLDSVIIIEGDLEDGTKMSGIIKDGQYDEVYNLGAMSFVKYSFENPIQTHLTNCLGVINLVQAIRRFSPQSRFYQASTSEMYGGGVCPELYQDGYHEGSAFHPRSPYGEAKLAAYWHVRNARDGYGLHMSNGILFNHESPRRGIEFVTQKVASAAAGYWVWLNRSTHVRGKAPMLRVGNIDAKRDWGDARDYVVGMWLMLQQSEPGDYVLATGEAHTVREMIEACFKEVGTEIDWDGEGQDEVAFDRYGNLVISINPEFYRPTDVDCLIGNAKKARKILGWRPEISFEEMMIAMVDNARNNIHQ